MCSCLQLTFGYFYPLFISLFRICFVVISLRLMLCKHKQHYKLCETIANILRCGYQVVYGTGSVILRDLQMLVQSPRKFSHERVLIVQPVLGTTCLKRHFCALFAFFIAAIFPTSQNQFLLKTEMDLSVYYSIVNGVGQQQITMTVLLEYMYVTALLEILGGFCYMACIGPKVVGLSPPPILSIFTINLGLSACTVQVS